MSKVKIAIAGINGRMGRFLAQTVANDEQAELVAATEFAGSSVIGCDAGELCGFGKIGVEVVDSIEKAAHPKREQPFVLFLNFNQALYSFRSAAAASSMMMVTS